MIEKIYRYRFYVLWLIFSGHLIICWPGQMVADSICQYQQAIAAQYTDHHPPIMSFVWHYLNLLHAGPGLMLLLQMTFLYFSLHMILRTTDKLLNVRDAKFAAVATLLVPLYPQIAIYAYMIVKDLQFAYSFLLVASLLAYYTIANKRPKWPVLTLLFIVSVYGASVKYQGKFCVIIPAVWTAYLLYPHKVWWQKTMRGLGIYAMIFASVTIINSVLVPNPAKNYSWQFVKLYDLAAISIATNQDLIPGYNQTQSYTYEKLKTRFKYPTVDPYIFTDDNILAVTKDSHYMKMLEQRWWGTVLQHPFLYLKHRAINMSYALLSRPGYHEISDWIDKTIASSKTNAVTHRAAGILFFMLMSHAPVIMMGAFYWLLSLYYWRASKAAPILFSFTSISILMLGILYFKSMAGVPRYTYIAVLMIHISHVFAYKSLRDIIAIKAAGHDSQLATNNASV